MPLEVPGVSSASFTCDGELYALKVSNSTAGARPSNNTKTPSELILTSYFSFRSEVSPGVLYPTSTFHLIPAALQALDEINNSTEVLRDFHLVLDIRDSQCDPILGRESLLRAVIDRADSDSPTVGLVGPGCSEVSEAIAGVYDRLNIPQVSYGQNSPRLSLRTRYPSFFQMTHSLEQTSETVVGVLGHFDWTERFALIHEDTQDYTLITQNLLAVDSNGNLVLESDQLNIQAVVTEFFKLTRQSDLRTQLESFMENVRAQEIRVVVGMFPELIAARLVCVAHQNNQTRPGEDGFVFVFSGVFSNQWWTRDNGFCNLTIEDVESIVIVTSVAKTPDLSAEIPSRQSAHDFKMKYLSRLREWCPNYDVNSFEIDPLAGATYDAVWSLAYALNYSEDILSQINSTTQTDLLVRLHNQSTMKLYDTDFSGASGPVRFNDVGVRIGVDAVLQVQTGVFVLVGYYNYSSITLETVNKSTLMWRSNSTPGDEPQVKEESVPLTILIISFIFTIAGVIFGICMIVFNWRYRKHKILIATSQRLNYIIITGVFFGYLSVVILTILESPLGLIMSKETFKALCLIRIWMLPLAFTFTYGTLFARAWRIYRIFNNPWVANRPLRDYHLLLMVLVVAAGDLLYLIPWTIVDPFRQSSTSTIDYDAFTNCVYVSCSSTYHIAWLAVLAIYKITVMIAGLLIINKVRQHVVQKKIFDDSKSLAAALYVSAIAFVVGTVVALFFLLTLRIVLAYVASAIWVNASSSGTLICIFLPKYYQIVLKKQKGRKYHTTKSLFFVTHPEVDHSGTSTPMPLRKKINDNSINETVDFEISHIDIDNIRGTEEVEHSF